MPVQVQPADEPRGEEKADEAVERMLVQLRNMRLDDRDRLASEHMNRLIWSAYAELRDRRARKRHAADRPESEQSIDGDGAQS